MMGTNFAGEVFPLVLKYSSMWFGLILDFVAMGSSITTIGSSGSLCCVLTCEPGVRRVYTLLGHASDNATIAFVHAFRCKHSVYRTKFPAGWRYN